MTKEAANSQEKDYSAYGVPAPELHLIDEFPPAPKRGDDIYNPKPSFLQRLSKKKMAEFEAENDRVYHKAYRAWEAKCNAIQEQNRIKTEEYNKKYQKWKEDAEKFLASQKNG